MLSIKQSKWRWASHVARENNNRWTIRLTAWQLREVKRMRGRPKTRWRDNLKAYIGMTSTGLANDRMTWKDYEEGYIQHGIEPA